MRLLHTPDSTPGKSPLDVDVTSKGAARVALRHEDYPPLSGRSRWNRACSLRPLMQTARIVRARDVDQVDDDIYFDPVLDTSVADDVAALMVSVRRALAEKKYNALRLLAHPHAIRREHAWLARLLGPEVASTFWTQVDTQVEAVRIVQDGVAEVYELVRHHKKRTSLRLVTTASYVKGRWRMTDAREATDERVVAVLLRGAPPEDPIDAQAWMADWTKEFGEGTRLGIQGGRGVLEQTEQGWSAVVRTGSGRDLARQMALVGPAAELLEKQPAATVISMNPALRARVRTDQIRWLSRAAYVFGKADASTVWVPSAAKAIPFPTWAAAVDGPLELPALSALWLRTQRQRGAWITRGMTTFMLPEVEIYCAGLNVAMVRELLRELAGRLLRHHQERVTLDYDANAPAVPGCAARLYRPSAEGPIAIPLEELATVLELGETFTVGEVECTLAPGRQGPRDGETYGRWGAIALRPDAAWWLEAA